MIDSCLSMTRDERANKVAKEKKWKETRMAGAYAYKDLTLESRRERYYDIYKQADRVNTGWLTYDTCNDTREFPNAQESIALIVGFGYHKDTRWHRTADSVAAVRYALLVASMLVMGSAWLDLGVWPWQVCKAQRLQIRPVYKGW